MIAVFNLKTARICQQDPAGKCNALLYFTAFSFTVVFKFKNVIMQYAFKLIHKK